MLKKRKCSVCGKSVKESNNFCPNCGTQIGGDPKKWGMLGKNDFEPVKTGIFESMGDKFLNKIVSSAFRVIEKEFQKGMQPNPKNPQQRMKLFVNGQEILPHGKQPKKDNDVKFLPIEFSNENLNKWKKMEKEEPKSNLKRVDDKIEYEVEIPEVKSIKDISIVKLENSLEIKAVGNKKGYLKRIPINLPLKKYSLVKGILTLELDAGN